MSVILICSHELSYCDVTLLEGKPSKQKFNKRAKKFNIKAKIQCAILNMPHSYAMLHNVILS